VRTVIVRLRQVMLRLSPAAALRFLLALGGILVAGWLLGGTGSAYAESATPEAAAPVPAALSAVTDTARYTVGTTVTDPAPHAETEPADGMAAVTGSRLDRRTARQIGGALDRIVSSPTRSTGPVVPAARVSVADTMDAVYGPAPTQERPARCGRICDLVRDLHEAPLLPPVSGHEPLNPGRIADVVRIDAPPTVRVPTVPSEPGGGGSASPAPGGTRPIWHHLGSAQGKGDRADSTGAGRRASADDADRVRART
jgi:hypothetical protein